MSETEDQVRRDAKPCCSICRGAGWHWGWTAKYYQPVQLRCPCVDEVRDRATAAPPEG